MYFEDIKRRKGDNFCTIDTHKNVQRLKIYNFIKFAAYAQRSVHIYKLLSEL